MEKTLRFSFETLVYIICNLFLLGVAGSLLYCGVVLLLGDVVFRYYVIGIGTLILIALSLAYINKYNKKYKKGKKEESDSKD
jgi:hypothetical protein